MTVPTRLIPLVHAVSGCLDRLKLEHAFGGALANNYRGILATQRGKLDLAYLTRWAAQVLGDSQRDDLERWVKEYATA